MLSIDDVLSIENQGLALESFRRKRDGAGPDGMRVSELEDYWKANHLVIEESIRSKAYRPSLVRLYEVPSHSGKRRQIANINVIDRFIEKLLQIQLQRMLEPLFLANSFAYQVGKGTLEAAMRAREYVQEGKTYLCELDIKDYFSSIDHGRMLKLCRNTLDEGVVALLHLFLRERSSLRVRWCR